ncbi:hypothetical protein L226DRAFT_539807 [Lentinus tigrinus ALCF2SS1-7]|uniref:uncharacterized protein n=1 Tax=Lentinus tigrinus ALCF2SS1-7 TaxID=1328758 RepID=UPI0011664006|nr:hypothetical protein L226DRAFT_539807 [Lentinus tigrinus ALCF2SS1-7]
MYPARGDSSKAAETPQELENKNKEDDTTSDMDVSRPPTPAKAPSGDADSIKSSRSSSEDPNGMVKTVDEHDESDMDMSPPASPTMKPVFASPVVTKTDKGSSTDKVDLGRPSLAIDTSVSSMQLPHEIPRLSSSASPVPTTPERAAAETGDDSDMDMSSPTSEAAPDLPRVPRAWSQKPASTAASKPPSAVPPAMTPQSEMILTTDSSAPAPTSSLDASLVQPPEADASQPAGGAADSTVQAPSLPTPATSARLPVESGELSPPVSEETLREETDVAEKDHDAIQVEKETLAPPPQTVPMAVDEPALEKALAEIPLSDALRMVVKLRFRHDPVTQEARVEPVLFSNRQLTGPESEATPTPAPEAVVQEVTEKEQKRGSDGIYDGTKHSLRRRFAQHQAALAEKVERLRKEYLALHEKWMVHCAKLDEIARASALEEAAATACRTTRRTAAMGDAVRSDLEMEQILASLGNEELTDANHLSAKNAATIPDMVSVTKGRVDFMYDDTNNRVEDPHEFYKLETGFDDWTEEEKAILLEKYAIYPKQFGIIAAFIPNKTPAQCVTYYYLHKNTTIDFRKVIAQYNTIGKRRRNRGKQKGNALLADILKHDDEVGRSSTPTSGRRKRGGGHSSTPVPPSSSTDSVDQPKRTGSRRGTAQNTPDATPDPEPTATKRPRRRANPSAKAAAAMEQENGEDVPEEDARPAKRTRKTRKSKAEIDDEMEEAASAPMEPKTTEPSETPVVRKKVPGSGSSWSAEDQALFLKLLAQYGDDFKRIASSMPNKTTVQVSAFYRANLTEMELAKVAALAPKRSPTPQENQTTRQQTVIPGTGIMTPTSKTSTPGVDAPSAVSRSRSSGRMSPPPTPSGTQSSETDKRPTSAAQRDSKPTPPPRPLQYQGGLAAAFAGPSRGPLSEAMARPPQAMPRVAPPLTITFPSALAYSNLSPSNFTDAQRRTRIAALHPGSASTPAAGTPPSVMEFSEFAPPTWQVPAAPQTGQSQVPGGPGLPATLETTEDLVRYLEHRTRLTAQNSDSDFM